MNRKPFQEATVQWALAALAKHGGSKRFLVADEVGLGKTLVAQGVIQGMCEPTKHLEIFYVCSSLSIIHQNRDALLDFLPPDVAASAKIEVDRLTLLPKVRPSRKGLFTLYTLTPGTLPSGRRTGRVDERAIIWHLLCCAIDGLSRYETMVDVFRRGVTSWDEHLQRAKQYNYRGIQMGFRRELAKGLGVSEIAWRDTIISELKRSTDEDPAALVSKCRSALARAGLENLSPDLIIFDEFQNFFELLMPGEDDDPVSRELMDLLLREGQDLRPAVLLLSATPYRLFSTWTEGSDGHYEQFFKLLGFLFGRASAAQNVSALKEDLRHYRNRLQTDQVGSDGIMTVRDEIVARLSRVMSRAERPVTLGDHRRLIFDRVDAPLVPLDIRIFRHMVEAARPEDHPGLPAYWMSIPYPLQMMDQKYVLQQHADPKPLLGEARNARMLWKQVRRYDKLHHPHPKLRRLLDRMGPGLLSLPWMPPSRPWWPIDGAFATASQRLGGLPSKILLFSRFRAVPRSIAAILSYEAERFCYSPANQRARGVTRPIAYEYRTDPGEKPAAGLKKRPSPSFTFPLTSKHETSMRSVTMFVPMPVLASLGDPLVYKNPEGGRPLSLSHVITQVARKLEKRLGRSVGRYRSRAVWPWAAALERTAPGWAGYSAELSSVADNMSSPALDENVEGITLGAGASRAMIAFVKAGAPERAPTFPELEELAEIAVLAPANVLYRAVSRVFGGSADVNARIGAVTRTSISSLRPYLDQPEFHLLFRGRGRTQHPEAIRRAIWDGNLESVLDEYLSAVRGLGVTEVSTDAETKALDSLGRALSVGSASITVSEIGKESGNTTFRMRCNAALPFGLGKQEVADQEGHFRYDNLRIAFNSPFRPHLLATTSIGQEGLDFHVWCNHVVHWDLPSNPVDLEQREGRVDRYAGLGIRQALATQSSTLSAGESPWGSIAARQTPDADGMKPWWVHEGAKIRRTVLVPSLSSMEQDLERLLDNLSLYRLALGQCDQEALLHALRRRLTDAGPEHALALAWLEKARINLGNRFISPNL